MDYRFLFTSTSKSYERFLKEELNAEIIVQRNYEQAARIVAGNGISGIVVPIYYFAFSDRVAVKSIEAHLGRPVEMPVFEGWKHEPKSFVPGTLKHIDELIKKEFVHWVRENFKKSRG